MGKLGSRYIILERFMGLEIWVWPHGARYIGG